MISDRTKCVAFTGYRPEKIRLSSTNPDIEDEIRAALRVVITDFYAKGYRYFLCGMAEGFDLMGAETVLTLKNEGICPEAGIISVIPFRKQAANYGTCRWESYDRILKAAVMTFVLSEEYYPECFARRNDFLVNNSSAVICYFDGMSGGTKYTVAKARKEGLPVVNIFGPASMLF